uniref:FBA_2 domain-containing protein n=2 Tax=Caenorhabditis tropicalis TaxID=1561998 RepID=A0A1I7T3P2_9PELO
MPFWKSIISRFFRKPTEKPFPFNRLPDVARIIIIRKMDGVEQVKLALSSKRMGQYMRIAMIRNYDYCQIKIEKDDFTIDLKHSVLPTKNEISIMGFQETTNLIGKDLKPGLNEDSSVAENAVTVLKRLQAAFPCKETGVIFIDNTPAVIKHVLDALGDLVYVSLGSTNPETEAVDLVMDSCKKGREIALDVPEMPLDYSHPNAFKFNIIYYYDARWVRLEHLFSMGEIRSVHFEKNNLKCEDLNALLKYWTTSDERMTRVLKFPITEEANIQERSLFEGLIFLKTVIGGKHVRLLANKRKQFTIYVSWTDKYFKIWTYSPNDSPPVGNEAPLDREYRILEILKIKRIWKMIWRTKRIGRTLEMRLDN